MRHPLRFIAIVLSLVTGISVLLAVPAAAQDHGSIVITYEDGHHQSFSMTEITSIDFKAPAIVFRDGHREKLVAATIARIEFQGSERAGMPPRSHFFGKWKVGDGGGHDFYITLDPDGEAHKTVGGSHGTWTLVDGEARITWEDGWHDAIRRVGGRHEKLAYEPGKSFADQPTNVAEAHNTEAKPI